MGRQSAPARRGYRILYHHRTGATDGQRVHIVETQRALRAPGHTVHEVAPLAAGEPAGVAPRPSAQRRIVEAVAAFAPQAGRSTLELGYNVIGRRCSRSASAPSS